MRGIKKYNRHEVDVIDRVYDKILSKRGIVKVYDKTLDETYWRKYSGSMQSTRGDNLVP